MRKMKDSGVSWIGEIPENWSTSPIKRHTYMKSGDNITALDITDDDEYVVYGGNGIRGKYSRFNTVGDRILVGRQGALAGNVHLTSEPIWATDHAIVTTMRGNENISYFRWVFEAANFNQYAFETAAQPGLAVEKIRAISIPLPDELEQQRIADFLDAKTAEIDTLRSQLEQQIEMLESYKRSVIIEAVTRGLEPSVQMKNSGIPWISKIPTHWDVRPVYFLFNERKTLNVFGLERNLLSLSYGKIIRKDINNRGGLLPANFNGYNVIQPNDIVLRFTDLQNDKRSLRTGLSHERGIVTSAYVTISSRPGQFAPYHHYLLHSYDVMKVFTTWEMESDKV